METLQTIFAQLGLDTSIFYQFLITVVIFLLAKFIFMDKLKFVIEQRESKTTKLEKEAERKLAMAMGLSEKYQSEIDKSYQKFQKQFQERRQELIAKEDELYRKTEEEITKQIESSRKQFFSEIEIKKNEVFANADSLANLLINKVSK